jgi:DNA-binding MarR family transcriptional regulator
MLDRLIIHCYTNDMSSESHALAREIRQTRPFQSLAHEAVLSLIRTAAVVQHWFGEQLAASGLTPTQYNILRILRGAGEGGLPTLAIRDRLLDLSPGITRLLDRLVADGLVARRRGADRRQVVCQITPAGKRLLARLDAPVHAGHQATMARLTAAQQRTLIQHLEAIRDAVTATAGQAS